MWGLITVRRVTAAGILIAAGSFGIACLEYWHKGQEERLQRALSLIEKINTERAEPQYRALATTVEDAEEAKWKAIEARRALVVYFRDRFDGKRIPEHPLERRDAESLRDTALKIRIDTKDRELFERWDTARRHLNELEIIAFAYVYDFADRKLLAAQACGGMVRSNAYFESLIEVLGEKFGYAQAWQIIPEAVKMMEREYGKGCENLYSPTPRSSWVQSWLVVPWRR